MTCSDGQFQSRISIERSGVRTCKPTCVLGGIRTTVPFMGFHTDNCRWRRPSSPTCTAAAGRPRSSQADQADPSIVRVPRPQRQCRVLVGWASCCSTSSCASRPSRRVTSQLHAPCEDAAAGPVEPPSIYLTCSPSLGHQAVDGACACSPNRRIFPAAHPISSDSMRRDCPVSAASPLKSIKASWARFPLSDLTLSNLPSRSPRYGTAVFNFRQCQKLKAMDQA